MNRSAIQTGLIATAALTAGILLTIHDVNQPRLTAPPSKIPRAMRAAHAATNAAANPADQPAAMRDAATYAASRLKEIKADPEAWKAADAWRREFDAANTPQLQREVFGLARQVGAEPLLAVLPRALLADNEVLRSEAVASLSFLQDQQLAQGIEIAAAAPDPEVRAAVMDLIAQLKVELRPEALRRTIMSGYADVVDRSIELITDQPSPALFSALVDGLQTSNDAMRTRVASGIDEIVHQRFASYAEAAAWWSTNRERYDDMMALAR